MKPETITVGDKVSWNEHPQTKSKVVEIKKSHFIEIDMYVLENGCVYQKHEIKKVTP